MSDIKPQINWKLRYLAIPMLAAGMLVVGFQNCTGFDGQISDDSSLSPADSGLFPMDVLANLNGGTPEDKFIYSLYPRDALAVGKSLEFWGFQKEFEGNVEFIFWDHEIWVYNQSEDRAELKYCLEIASESDWAYLIECEHPGELYLTLIVVYQSGDEDVIRAKADILMEAGSMPDPLDPSMPVEPTPLDGVALYNMHCAGCHGAYASTTKPSRSAAQISGAINGNVGGMGFLSSLSAAEVEAIATALGR